MNRLSFPHVADQKPTAATDLNNLHYRGINASILNNMNFSMSLSSWWLQCPANAPHGGDNFFWNKKSYTTGDTWANWASREICTRPLCNDEIREYVEVMWWWWCWWWWRRGRGGWLLPKPQTTQWTFNQAAARKRKHMWDEAGSAPSTNCPI